MKYFLLLMTISGCSFEKTKNIIEIINEHEYEYYCGYNAAVLQFENEHSDLIVDLSNKKVLTYTASKDNNSYADGYHKALNIIVSRDNKHCPDPRSIK